MFLSWHVRVFVYELSGSGFESSCSHLRIFYIGWSITATAMTKRNTVNKEILINKKSFAHI